MVPPDEVELSLLVREPSAVRHDPRALVQAILNLLVNAYKYTRPPSGSPSRSGTRRPWVRISVEDNGIGIPARELERIFEPFYRVGSAARAAGAGLGLAIVRHLVKAHGGRSRSRAGGRGSRFTICLPASRRRRRDGERASASPRRRPRHRRPSWSSRTTARCARAWR